MTSRLNQLLCDLRKYRRSALAWRRDGGAPTSAADLVRFFPRWRRYKDGKETPLDAGLPWMTFAAIDRLERLAGEGGGKADPNRPLRVFEWGAGGSSAFLLARGAEVTSVEHVAEWLEKTRSAVESLPGAWTPLTRLPETDVENPGDPSDPTSYAAWGSQDDGTTFRSYVEAIDEFPDGHFDLVIVDGRARSSCARQAAPKVRPGGGLLWDNTDRPHYHPTLDELARVWRVEHLPGPSSFVPFFTRTTLLIKPGASGA